MIFEIPLPLQKGLLGRFLFLKGLDWSFTNGTPFLQILDCDYIMRIPSNGAEPDLTLNVVNKTWLNQTRSIRLGGLKMVV